MFPPEYLQQFEEALRCDDPSEALYRLAISLRDAGTTQLDLYLLFERFLLNESGASYDAIADNMDLIWSGAWAKGRGLFEAEITPEVLDNHRRSGFRT